jgi:hypothetical protein
VFTGDLLTASVLGNAFEAADGGSEVFKHHHVGLVGSLHVGEIVTVG